MTKEKELSLEEMITLARKVEYWERVENGVNTYVAYEGAVGNLSVDVGTWCVLSGPPEHYSGRNYDWGPGEVTSYIQIYNDINTLGCAIGLRVDEVIDLAEKKYLKRMGLSRTALMKEAKALLRKK